MSKGTVFRKRERSRARYVQMDNFKVSLDMKGRYNAGYTGMSCLEEERVMFLACRISKLLFSNKLFIEPIHLFRGRPIRRFTIHL